MALLWLGEELDSLAAVFALLILTSVLLFVGL